MNVLCNLMLAELLAIIVKPKVRSITSSCGVVLEPTLSSTIGNCSRLIRMVIASLSLSQVSQPNFSLRFNELSFLARILSFLANANPAQPKFPTQPCSPCATGCSPGATGCFHSSRFHYHQLASHSWQLALRRATLGNAHTLARN